MPNIVTPDWLTKYYERGFRLIFYPAGQKGPKGPDAIKWTERSDSPTEYAQWIEKFDLVPNIGVFLGHEISPNKFLADVDFDWAEGLLLSRHILPRTGFGFGRPTRQISHAFYTTPAPLVSRVFEGIDGKPIVELRGTTVKGTVGLQTMMPPSIHPNGEQLILRSDDEIGYAESLERDVTLYAIACILYKALGHRGMLHDVRLAVAGFLLTTGLDETETIRVCGAIAEVSGNNVQDTNLAVKSTFERIKSGARVLSSGALAKILGDDGKKIVAKIREWLGGEEFIVNKEGKILADNEENILRAIDKLAAEVSYNMFSCRPLIKYGDYDGLRIDRYQDRLWLDIQREFKFKPSREVFGLVLDSLSFQYEFHPVQEYLGGLVWDGVPRVDNWLITYGGAGDSPYTKAVGALVLIAAVRRVRKPGCKFDEMMVLESEQGKLKSSALRALCPKDDWFSDDLPLNIGSKEVIERTGGKWIIEASELSGMSASRVEHLKGFLSRSVDGPARLAYARLPVEQPRQFIVIGTTNSQTYLQDDTGNRRFWPVAVEQFDVAGLTRDRDQIWAEAAHREAAGESIRLSEEHYGLAAIQQERRENRDPWEQAIEQGLARILADDDEPQDYWDKSAPIRVANRRVQAIIYPSGVDRMTKKEAGRMAAIMQHLGFRRTAIRNKETGQPEIGWARGQKLKPGRKEHEDD